MELKSEKKIMEELKDIKKKISTLGKRVVDVDTVLTEDDESALKEGLEDLKKGKTTKISG